MGTPVWCISLRGAFLKVMQTETHDQIVLPPAESGVGMRQADNGGIFGQASKEPPWGLPVGCGLWHDVPVVTLTSEKGQQSVIPGKAEDSSS